MIDTKALKQKILDLAIRGKLVPQDPADEPVSILLDRIRAEKQKSGKGKNQPDSVIFRGDDNSYYEKIGNEIAQIDNEVDFEAPSKWEFARLNTLCSILGGKTPSTEQNEYWGEEILWVTSKDMQSKYIDNSILKLSNLGAAQLNLFPANTLLIVVRSGILRHTIPLAILTKNATINQDLKALHFYSDSTLVEWIYLWLKANNDYFLTKYVKGGTTVESIKFDSFQNMIIPLPSISEQQRVINTVNYLFALIDSIEAQQTDVQSITDDIQKRVLDLAIRGKLVQQDPADEPASALLKRIRAEKEALVKADKIRRDKADSYIYKGDDNSYYQGNKNIDDLLPFDIPDSWAWCRLGFLVDFSKNFSISSSEIASSDWILDLEDIEKDTGTLLCKKRMKDTLSKSDKHVFYKGNVLYSKLRPYLNKVIIADENGYCTTEILALDFGQINSEYAQLFLMSSYFVEYAMRDAYGVKMPRIGSEQGNAAFMPIPPIKEQARIVEAVNLAKEMLNSF